MNTDNQENEYFIERLTENNLADIEELHAAVYGKMPPPGFFFKKYNTAFTGVNYMGYIAYKPDGLPIAYYGVIPCFIKIDDKLVLSAQSADTMTHPGFRFKGLFVELSNLTFQLCRDNNINLLFGFPNQNSIHGAVNKLHWLVTEQMECFVIQSGGFPWHKVFNKLPFLTGGFSAYQKKQISKYVLPQQGIANSVFEDGFAGVYRDNNYLNYKTYTPNYVIKTGNSILWIKIGATLVIGDILIKPADFDDMMHHLLKLARKLGIAEVYFHTSTGTALHSLFLSRWEPIPSFAVLFQDFKGDIEIDKIKFTSADIDTF